MGSGDKAHPDTGALCLEDLSPDSVQGFSTDMVDAIAGGRIEVFLSDPILSKCGQHFVEIELGNTNTISFILL